MKDEILRSVDESSETLVSLSKKIWGYKEIGFEEKRSSAALEDFLEGASFHVERGAAGMPTAFVARAGSGSPHVAILAEYDALPSVGHGCGHNIIAVVGPGAAAACRAAGVVDGSGGTITVVGSPAEEISPAKKRLVDAGVFEGVDAALMVHPASMSTGYDIAYAVRKYTVEFFGKSAHAASAPEEGVNALDAMISFFSGIGLLRQQLPESVRVHGIIDVGGQAYNSIPEYTKATFAVRALTLEKLEEVAPRVEALVGAAAKMTGCNEKLTVLSEMPDVWVNVPIAEALHKSYAEIGEPTTGRAYEQGVGSTDMGAVTYAVPAIHGYINITQGENIMPHTHEFAAAANSSEGYDAMLRATKAVALTVYALLTDQSLRDAARQYFTEKRRDF